MHIPKKIAESLHPCLTDASLLNSIGLETQTNRHSRILRLDQANKFKFLQDLEEKLPIHAIKRL